MNAVEIEEAISKLAEQPFDAEEFPFAFLQAFGNKETTIKRLRSGASNKSDLGGVLQTSNIHIAVAPAGEVAKTLAALKASPATARAKDERLNFTSYVSSDRPLKSSGDRTDITVYNRRVAYRGDNEASNPITIFEFKKPQRDDFADPSSKEDPVQQIIRYVNQIREGKFKTPTGRDILVNDTTPFYGYVVCDLTKKVKNWLQKEKNFTPMPDGLGWFNWFGNISLYMEVISWTKLLRDAEMRNKVFFNKLGID